MMRPASGRAGGPAEGHVEGQWRAPAGGAGGAQTPRPPRPSTVAPIAGVDDLADVAAELGPTLICRSWRRGAPSGPRPVQTRRVSLADFMRVARADLRRADALVRSARGRHGQHRHP